MTAWLTRREAARYVRLSETVFKRQVKAGRFPPGRAASDRRLLWRTEDLDSALGLRALSTPDPLSAAIDELVG